MPITMPCAPGIDFGRSSPSSHPFDLLEVPVDSWNHPPRNATYMLRLSGPDDAPEPESVESTCFATHSRSDNCSLISHPFGLVENSVVS